MTNSIIAGIDSKNNIRIEIKIKGLYKTISYGAVLDTGYSGGVVLPLVTAVDIGLEKVGAMNVTLADGTIKTLPTFLADVVLGGHSQDATVLVMGTDVLIGMELIEKYQVCIAPYSGTVDITPAGDMKRIETFAETLRQISAGTPAPAPYGK